MEFRGAVFHRVGEGLTIENIAMDTLQPGDVLIKMKASGLCHSELEVMQGKLPVVTPIVMGHEGAGVVEAVGAGVTRVKPGDHVVCSWNPSCGHCFYCDRDQPILCESIGAANAKGMMSDGTSRYRLNGEHIHHWSFIASHGEYTIVKEEGAIPIPKDIPFDRACLIGCGVMTGVGGAIRIAQVAVGSNAVTFGCGAVGLNTIQGVKLAQAALNIAVDISDERLQLASVMGATHLINAKKEDPIQAVRELTNGRGADYALEAGGTPTTIQNSIEAVRPGGMVVILGKIPANDPLTLRFGSMMGERVITRSSYGGARPSRDFPMLAQYYLDGKLKLDELITSRITLNEMNGAFDKMAKGQGIRSVVIFD